jgi:predicted negative regulator of RcsB-dependent stress response
MTRTGAAARPQLDDRANSLLEWAVLNTRALAIAGAVILAVALAGWLYLRSQQSKEERASLALAQATESVLQGNFALAQNDLQRVVSQYGGTDAGKQALLALSEVLYDQGKFSDGVSVLETKVDGAPEYLRATFYAQIAAGYEAQGNFPKAGDTYQQAAKATRFDTDRALYLANAARSYAQGGNTKAALQIWQAQAANQSSPVADEARIRIGELTAQPATKAQ